MKGVYIFLRFLFIVAILTITTQVGGIVYIIYLIIARSALKKRKPGFGKLLLKLSLFSLLYGVICFVVVPPFAEYYGRRPLPLYASEEFPLKPAKAFYFLTNRNYVKPKLLEAIRSASLQTKATYPELTLMYLDGNFPFINNFPLLPHLSHDDGEKLDLAFIYKKLKNDQFAQKHPSWLGYGFSEKAKSEEYNAQTECLDQGKWWYNLSNKVIPKYLHKRYSFPQAPNELFISNLVKEPSIRKIFIEPHLKARLGMNSHKKVRFAGCHSVIHDDHIHVQL